jgi:hypothetical protein
MPSGKHSTPNIKISLQRCLVAAVMPLPTNRRTFCWARSMTPLGLSKESSTRVPLSSSGGDRNHCQVEGGAGSQLSQNRRRCSA